MATRKPHRIVSANYAAYFMIIGAWMPFISLYLQDSGWTGTQIGLFTGVGPLVTLLTQPLWGLLSDIWGNTRTFYSTLLP